MDIIRAKELLSVLADGINPLTGEVLPENDSCNQVEIVRALHTAVTELERIAKRRAKPQPENAGKPWTKEEEEEIKIAYRNGIKVSEIADRHKRTRGSIVTRLVRMGELKDETQPR